MLTSLTVADVDAAISRNCQEDLLLRKELTWLELTTLIGHTDTPTERTKPALAKRNKGSGRGDEHNVARKGSRRNAAMNKFFLPTSRKVLPTF